MFNTALFKIDRGAWAAQSVKCPTLGFASDHELRVMRSRPAGGILAHWEVSFSPASSLSPSARHPTRCVRSLKINK